jgi:hypothetical protein
MEIVIAQDPADPASSDLPVLFPYPRIYPGEGRIN